MTNLKEIYKVPEEKQCNTNFTILGKALSYAGEFENSCIELAKFSLIQNQVKKLPPPNTSFDYEDMIKKINLEKNQKKFKNFNKNTNRCYDKSLYDYINHLFEQFSFTKNSIKHFYEAKDVRNKIAHHYPNLFFRDSNDKKKLDTLIIELKNDIKVLAYGNLVIYLFYEIIFTTNNININKFRDENNIILDKYVEQIEDWIFNQN